MYIYQRPEWPNFTWDFRQVADLLSEIRYLQGHLLGQMDSLGFPLRTEAVLQTLTNDVVNTSAIEGEKLSKKQVRTSIAKRLGLDIGFVAKPDRRVEGIVELLWDATQHYDQPLTAERLFGWHVGLFPTGGSRLLHITVGQWRLDSVQIISGPCGHEKVHYEAPSTQRVPQEMEQFLHWINHPPAALDLILQSAIAHFWFESIHPFDDGNGRIGRAIADLLLARSDKTAWRFYSMSRQIHQERKSYYKILEHCSKESLDITAWILWFLQCLKRAILSSQKTLETILHKSRFWRIHSEASFNERQRRMINHLLDGSFYGNLNSSKWAKMTKCSHDTALRDITDLLNRGILAKDPAAGGRSTHYYLL